MKHSLVVQQKYASLKTFKILFWRVLRSLGTHVCKYDLCLSFLRFGQNRHPLTLKQLFYDY